MNRPHGKRARLGGGLLAAVAAMAILALPGLAASHNRDHEPPGDAGTIQSFDPETGVLVIDLANGGDISGLVNKRTHVRCGPPPRRGHGGPGPSPRRGSESGRPGHGPGGPGASHEAGEDPPGHDGTAPGNSEDPGKGAEHSAHCNVDDLIAGATVKVAELVLVNGNAYYRMVGLPRQAPAPPSA
jgi:hypothetical protein